MCGEKRRRYAYYGDVIKVTANTAPTGKVFDTWVVTGLDTTGMDLTNPEITFNMPANVVEIKATYGEAKYNVSVTGGTVDKAKAKYGDLFIKQMCFFGLRDLVISNIFRIFALQKFEM